MLEQLLVEHCSPTMAGLKTGNLFNCPLADRKELAEHIRRLNTHLSPRGVRILPLKYGKDKVLIYMYRPDRLQEDLNDQMAAAILSEKSYPTENVNRCLVELIRRLNHDENFPHEIGLFLGYPSEDVHCFIKKGARQAKCVGTWKVYGDEESAKRKFAQYKKCTRVYCDAFRKNHSFDRLVVSCS